MKIVNIQEENPYLLNELRNFNKIFKKDVTYDNIKSHKKKTQGFAIYLKKTFLEKPKEGKIEAF